MNQPVTEITIVDDPDGADPTTRARVLIVEDENIVSLDLTRKLTTLGYEVTGTASDGARAISLATQHRPDLILMDILLNGELDGVQTATIIRQELDIPVIYITAFADSETIDRAKRTEPVGYIVKPFDEVDIRTTVEIGLHRHQATAAERKRNTLARVLQETAAALNSSLSLSEVLDRILGNVLRLVPADTLSLMLLDGDTAYVVGCHGYEDDEWQRAVQNIQLDVASVPHLGDLVERVTPIVLSEREELSEWGRLWYMDDLQTAISAPLVIDDQVIGILSLFSIKGDFALQPDCQEYLQAFADQAAVAIQNARAHEQLQQHNENLERIVLDRTAEVQQAKDHIETIIDNSAEAILLLSKDGDIRSTNLTFHDIFGYEPDVVAGLTLFDLIDPQNVAQVQHAITLSLRRGAQFRISATAQRANGTAFDADFSLSPLPDDGDLSGIVCSIHDISALRQADRMKDRFISSVSHELRTPITSLKLSYELLSRKPENQTQFMPRMARDIERLEVIIENLLHMSRLDQGQFELRMQAIKLNDLVSNYVADMIPMAQRSEIHLTSRLHESLPRVWGDPVLMEQVLGILVNNALNYARDGADVVVQTQRRTDSAGEWVGFSVTDNGPGISAEDLPHVFERFYRGVEALNTNSPGTGLGLALAQELVGYHGGTIEVTSSGIPGEGARFEVWLPAVESHLLPDALAADTDHGEDEMPYD